MERQRGRGLAPGRRTGRWRPMRLVVAGVALVLVEWALVGEVGTPATLLATLRHAGDAWADPVGSVVAPMALSAETLVAYLLAVLVLQGLASLPGAVGRVAARATVLLTPLAARRGLELLVGGTLLAHSTINALTRDGQHRTLHFIDKVTVAGRMQYGYRSGVVPEG